MPAKQSKKPAQVDKKRAAGLWDASLGPFLARHSLTLAIALVAIASLRIVSTYLILSPTIDEPGHFACGLEYLQKHVYLYEAQHPPLARAAMALGPYMDGARLLGGPQRDVEGRAILKHAANRDRMIFLMRLGILPFFLLACASVYGWTRRHFDGAVAVVATGLFTLVPSVLAHAGLATTDMAVTGSLIAAYAVFLVWAESPTWLTSVGLGVTGGMAVLSKFTALGYFPSCVAMFGLLYLIVRRPGWKSCLAFTGRRLGPLVIAMTTLAITIWAGYWFSFGPAPGLGWNLPAPEFVQGIQDAIYHNQKGHPAFLLGEHRSTGWWYYFPVVLGVKTPLGLLLLILGGCVLAVARRGQLGYLALMGFVLGILTPAMASHVNIGVRHILPIYAAFAILAAVALVELLRSVSGKPGEALAAGLLLWIALSGAVRHPEYLAYFNEFAWSAPEKVLIDSDLDWGQDFRRLAERFKQLGISKYACNFEGNLIMTAELYGLPPCRRVDPWTPWQGWTAISTLAAEYDPKHPILHGLDAANIAEAMAKKTAWFEVMDPTERLGGLRLFYIPPGTGVAE